MDKMYKIGQKISKPSNIFCFVLPYVCYRWTQGRLLANHKKQMQHTKCAEKNQLSVKFSYLFSRFPANIRLGENVMKTS